MILLLQTSHCLAEEIAVDDDFDSHYQSAQPAQRIISLYGAFNEILLALECADKIVGRTDADKNIPELAALPSIGTHMRPNIELVVAQKPDLVLQMSGRKESTQFTDALRKLGINVLSFELNSLEQLFAVTRKIGILTGKEKAAQALIEKWQARLASLNHSAANRPAIFYEIRYPDLLAAGASSIISDIIKAAGGQNVVSAPGKIAHLNEEFLFSLNPDVYIYQQGPMNPDPEAPAKRNNYKSLGAIRDNCILKVDERLFSRPGPGSIKAAEILNQWLNSPENIHCGKNK